MNDPKYIESQLVQLCCVPLEKATDIKIQIRCSHGKTNELNISKEQLHRIEGVLCEEESVAVEPNHYEFNNNRIVFDNFVVTCDMSCADPIYMQEMAEELKFCNTGAEAFEKLWELNNDGTWTVSAE